MNSTLESPEEAACGGGDELGFWLLPPTQIPQRLLLSISGHTTKPLVSYEPLNVSKQKSEMISAAFKKITLAGV